MAKPKEAVEQPKPRRVGAVTFMRETMHELRRVRWPGRKEVVSYTSAALVVCFLMGLLVWAFDVGISKLLSLVNIA